VLGTIVRHREKREGFVGGYIVLGAAKSSDPIFDQLSVFWTEESSRVPVEYVVEYASGNLAEQGLV